MHEGMVSVGSEEGQRVSVEHEPLTARDLGVLNEGLGEEGIEFLRNVATLLANARRQGMTVDPPLVLKVEFDLEGPDLERLQSVREEAGARGLNVHRVNKLDANISYFGIDS